MCLIADMVTGRLAVRTMAGQLPGVEQDTTPDVGVFLLCDDEEAEKL